MKKRRGEGETRGDGDKPLLRVSVSKRLRVPKIITLLTDFGNADYFVGALKGAILSVNPTASIVDITHAIPAYDVEAAAFTLLAAYSAFPEGTIHVAVVDPGVGSARQGILINTQGHYFIGPDNGTFSYVCDRADAATVEIFHLNNVRYFREPVSPTFHGRDVFAPVAAAVSSGLPPDKLGTRIQDVVRLPSITPDASRDGKIKGRIIHIDRFGNCVTNITPAELTASMIADGALVRIKGKTVKSFRNYFAEDSGKGDKLFATWGSAGFLEIAVANDSAAKLLKAKRGDVVMVSRQ